MNALAEFVAAWPVMPIDPEPYGVNCLACGLQSDDAYEAATHLRTHEKKDTP